jgi:serine/threonine protein kinase
MVFPSRTEIVTAMKNPQACYKSSELIGGSVVMRGATIVQYAGGYATVFPFMKNGKKIAVRCWCADIGNAKQRSQKISDFLQQLKSPYFLDFKYIENAILINGTLHPIILMEWAEGKLLKDYISENCNSQTFKALADKFLARVEFFHSQNISHGDLQHGNMIVKANGDIVLCDYDSMYIDSLKGMSDVINGLPGYQHPARTKNVNVTPKADYFSELVIYLSLLIFAKDPHLWKTYNDTEDLLFSKEDFVNLKQSRIYLQYHNSPDKNIANLLQRMEEELKKTDIQYLLPLEDLRIDKTEKMIAGISNKWDNQPNKPEPKQPVIKIDIESIKNKF